MTWRTRLVGVATLVALAACAPAAEEDTLVLRQAGLGTAGTPELTGPTGLARLGASLGSCDEYDGTYAVGAPGETFVQRISAGGTALDTFAPSDAGEYGSTALCGFALPVGRELFGASRLAWYHRLPDAGVALSNVLVSSMVQADVRVNPRVLIAHDDGLIEFIDLGQQPRTLINHVTSDGGSVSPRLAFPPGRNDVFAEALPYAGEVKLISVLPDAGPRLDWARNIGIGPTAVAVGDFHPAMGLEVAVRIGATVKVFTTADSTSPPLFTFTPNSISTNALYGFGASLAAEPNDAGAGLAALWIGSPGEDTVYRYLGDAGHTLDTGSMAQSFGAAIAFSRQAEVVIGAPGYQGTTGAVYRLPLSFTDFVADNAHQMQLECSAGANCMVNDQGTCFTGKCVGGVLCNASSNAIGYPCFSNNDAGTRPDGGLDPMTDGGEVDAGEVDAGEVDAGEVDAGEVDAGEVDAGEVDGGAPDAGGIADAGSRDAGLGDGGVADAGVIDAGVSELETDFIAQGCACSSGSSWPWVLAVVVLALRRAPRG